MDISVAMDQSYQDDFAMGQIYESTYITEELTSNVIQDLDTVRALDDLSGVTTIQILLTLKPC